MLGYPRGVAHSAIVARSEGCGGAEVVDGPGEAVGEEAIWVDCVEWRRRGLCAVRRAVRKSRGCRRRWLEERGTCERGTCRCESGRRGCWCDDRVEPLLPGVEDCCRCSSSSGGAGHCDQGEGLEWHEAVPVCDRPRMWPDYLDIVCRENHGA